MMLNYLIRLEHDIVNNVTNKLIGVLKWYHNEPRSHRLVKSEIVGFDCIDLIIATEKLCAFASKSSSTLKYLLETKGLDMWVLNVVEDALSKLNNGESYTHYDDIYAPLMGRIGMTIKRTLNSENDGIACDDETLCYYIDLVEYSKSSDSNTTYSITLVLANDITL